jgi:hypothetical protein
LYSKVLDENSPLINELSKSKLLYCNAVFELNEVALNTLLLVNELKIIELVVSMELLFTNELNSSLLFEIIPSDKTFEEIDEDCDNLFNETVELTN